ncbi:MAG: SRPBCC family protein [Verrucomicrobiae bacterium]|nr:SRPBCC family protein [Verrucomicrobiae bacterium]
MKALSVSLLLGLLVTLAWCPQARAEESAEEYVNDAALWKQLLDGKVVLLSKVPEDDTDGKEEDQHSGTAATIIDAPIQAVWEVIDDKESAPDYIESLQSAKIIERTPEHILIEQVMKLGPLPTVTYVVKHVPSPPHLVTFERHSGDMQVIRGFWKLFTIDNGAKTLVVYRLSLKPGFVVPNFVIRNSLKKSLPDALRAVSGQVKKRQEEAGAKKSPKTP